jgi:dihydroneopterin triphosphate diphosphatase
MTSTTDWETNMERSYRHPVQVLVYCFRWLSDSIEYLMLQRTTRYGGFWQGVTGAPEGDESLLDGARRELFEETQISPKDVFQVDFSYTFPIDDEWKLAYHPDVKSIDEFVFLAEISYGVEPVLSHEHDCYEWTGIDRARSLLKWPNNRLALEFCDNLLRCRLRE